MIVHKGKAIPQMVGKVNPNDIDWIWLSWRDRLDGSTISASSWSLPNSWTIVSQTVDGTVIDTVDGASYSASNGILMDVASGASGVNSITNHVLMVNSRFYSRTIHVDVQPI